MAILEAIFTKYWPAMGAAIGAFAWLLRMLFRLDSRAKELARDHVELKSDVNRRFEDLEKRQWEEHSAIQSMFREIRDDIKTLMQRD